MKTQQKVVKFLVTLCVYLLSAAIVTMLINLAANYISLILKDLVISLKHKHSLEAQGLEFHFYYLVSMPKGFHWYLSVAAACVIVSIYGRRTVMRISQWIVSLLPISAPSIEGSSRWATKREMKRYLTAIDKEEITAAPQAGVLLAADKNNYYVDTETVNTFVIGTTRSGKSQLLVLNTIRMISQCGHPQSFVAFDLKGELIESSYAILKQKNYNVLVYNLDKPNQSSRRNNLVNIIDAYAAEADSGGEDFSLSIELAGELAQIITDNPKSDPVWPSCAKSLLTAMILYLLEDGYKRKCLDRLNLYSIYNFFIEFGSRNIKVGKKTVNALDSLMSNLPVGHPAKMAYASSKFADGEMRSSIFSILADNLALFGDSGIAYLTGENDIDFKALANPNQPCAIFMVAPDDKKTRYKLASLFVTQCYAELLEISRGFPRGMLPQRVHFILDELGNMPRIPDLSTKVTTGLGHNILIDIYVQSLAQLEEKYGRLDASTIQGNCGNWVYLNSLDKDTNKYVSELLGNSTTEYQTYNADNGDLLDKTRMKHYKSRPLKTPDELPRMEEGKVVVIRQRCFPMQSQLSPFYKLKIPVTSINIIMPMAKISLKDILYPIEKIGASENESNVDEEPDTDKIKLQAVLNNVNILTQSAFGCKVAQGDITAARGIIDHLTVDKRLSEEQADILKDYIQTASDENVEK